MSRRTQASWNGPAWFATPRTGFPVATTILRMQILHAGFTVPPIVSGLDELSARNRRDRTAS